MKRNSPDGSDGSRSARGYPFAAGIPGVLAVCLVLAGVPAPAHAQDWAARIDEIFSFATPETPGCAVGVSRDGKVTVSRAWGLADVERRVPLTPHSIFDIGSVQKQFVAASVLLLVEDGRLSLSDDVRRHVPELPDYGHTITLDHLLTHTGGLRDWTGLLPLAEEGADVLNLILRQRGLNFSPGEEWSYSNSGYVLLKEIVARASGMSFAEFARSRIFEPLGMTSSAYVADILHGTGERALAYRKDGEGWTQYMRLGNERGGGAVISNAGDLLTWNDALAAGRLGARVTARLQEQTTLANGRRLSYARGLNLDNDIPGGPMVWHSGGAAGYGTFLARFTDHGLSLVALCNFEPISTTSLAGRVADLFLPPVDPAAQRPGPTAAAGVEVAGRAGLFFAEDTAEPLRLIASGGRLGIAGGPSLVPVDAGRFQPARTSLFFRSQDAFELAFRSDDEFDLTSTEGRTTRYRRGRPWTPTPADLQGVHGRYGSAELGTVVEIVPGTTGIVMRLERSPEQAQELEPVARDTYMRNLASVRFRRDASGTVVGFDYGNPVVRSIGFTRIGAGPASAPASGDTAPGTPAGAPDEPPPLEGLVGEYEMAPGRTLAVTLDGGQLHGQPAGSEKRVMVHVAGATFAPAGTAMTLTFTLAADGRATAVVMRQNGRERTLPKVR
jgi:CubicO group peptidase (beta-lactamase class C family)